MSTLYSVGQMNQVGDALEGAGYSPDDVTKLRAPDVLEQVKLVLMGLATIIRHSFKLACTKAFNPVEFIGKGWGVWKGPVNGNGLEGEEERDKRANALDVIDWEQVLLEAHLQGDETLIGGEDKLKRANASGNIQLGDKQFISLWEDYKENGKNSVLEKLRLKGVKRIYFFGTTLRRSDGDRYVLCLYIGGSEWHWHYHWLDLQWNADNPSASLASV